LTVLFRDSHLPMRRLHQAELSKIRGFSCALDAAETGTVRDGE
jgi:hypothetical protein